MSSLLDFVLPEAGELSATEEKIPVVEESVLGVAPDGQDGNRQAGGASEPQPFAAPPAVASEADDAADEMDAAIVDAREIFLLAALERSKLEGQLKRAKKREKDALEAYRDLVGRQQELPLCDPDPTERRTDFLGNATSTNDPVAAPSTWDEFGDWRDAPLAALTISPALYDKLIENDIHTIGQLEDLRAGDGLQSLKGIGQGKADKIEEAVIRWLSENRDKELFAAAAGDGDCGKSSPQDTATAPPPVLSPDQVSEMVWSAAHRRSIPTPLATSTPAAIAENDPRTQHAAAVEARAAELLAEHRQAEIDGEGAEPLEPQCEEDRWWNAGVEAFDRGTLARDCPWEAEAMEDWLRGWLTAKLDQEGG